MIHKISSASYTVVLILITATALLYGCTGQTDSKSPDDMSRDADATLTAARDELISISSFTAEFVLADPIPGSTEVFSGTRVWESPDLLFDATYGHGEPSVQRSLVSRDKCLVHRTGDDSWQESRLPCVLPDSAIADLKLLTNLEDISVLDKADQLPDGSTWIGGTLPVGTSGEPIRLYGVSVWHLELDSHNRLVKAIGYDSDMLSAVEINFTGYNDEYAEFVSSLRPSLPDDLQ
jgi:hypothetical protein